jgi:hypothetical protein
VFLASLLTVMASLPESRPNVYPRIDLHRAQKPQLLSIFKGKHPFDTKSCGPLVYEAQDGLFSEFEPTQDL